MRQGAAVILLLSTIILFSAGCVSEPGIDKNKFSELNRTARDLRIAIAPDKPCEVPDTLLQKLASGTSALRDKAASKAEAGVIGAYSRLLDTYQDGLLLCKYRTHLNQFQFVPRGRIYVFQELDPVVVKYDLPTESHVYKPTGVHWRSIAWDSINVIWESAELQTKNIENMVNYN
jgi:hypothetical protein